MERMSILEKFREMLKEKYAKNGKDISEIPQEIVRKEIDDRRFGEWRKNR